MAYYILPATTSFIINFTSCDQGSPIFQSIESKPKLLLVKLFKYIMSYNDCQTLMAYYLIYKVGDPLRRADAGKVLDTKQKGFLYTKR